jgi:hypothetical protein
MEFFWFLLCGSGVMVVAYLLVVFYMRRKDGVQPRYTGLLLTAASLGCFLAVAYVLVRFGVDLQSGRSREIVSLVLGTVCLVSAVGIAYQRQSSGTVLMDIATAPMFRLLMVCGVLVGVLAIASAIYRESHARVFAYVAWSAWLFVRARGRFQVRDRGIMTSGLRGLLSWDRIARCVATADNMVRLHLNKGLERAVDLKLPADRRDEFIQLVSQRRGANPAQVDPDSVCS